jgi:hypothetical protein
MVTRTIISTKVTALCVNTQTAETTERVFTLSGKIEDKAKALKKVSKDYNTDVCTCVAVRELSPIEALYGMSETDFIAGAVILDPVTRKAIEADTVTKAKEQRDAE